MLSIVVPAVWGHEPFCNFLSNVVELPVVGEIIIINNNVSRTPSHDVLSNPKVKIYNQEENIFVNPAWNLGVSLAENNKICILSDDVLVDLRVFFEADRFVSKDIGVLAIGIPNDLFRAQNNLFEQIDATKLIVSGDIKIKSFDQYPDVAGVGSLFFIHKENWIDIPNDFKIYFGDTWQIEMQTALHRTNYYINNCFYHTPWNMAVKIGVSAEYQQTEEYKSSENSENYKLLFENKLKELKNGR